MEPNQAKVSSRNVKFRVIMVGIVAGLFYFVMSMNDSIDRLDVIHEPIDIVVSWVNGSDSPRYTSHTNDNRWRDWDELRYSLRSIEAHAAWFRKLYLVVNNADSRTLPLWLDTSQDRLVIVPVSDIFQHPQEDLPTSNSNAVEMNLHHIKNISKRFIYMNNDYFINKHVDKSMFFYPRGQKLYLHIVSQGDTTDSVVPRDVALVYNKKLLDTAFGYQLTRALDVHAPLGLDKAILSEMAQGLFKEQFDVTSSHKHRNETDIILSFFYPHYVASTGRGYPARGFLWTLKNIIQFGLRDSIWRNRFYMGLVNLVGPVFFCVNDDVIGPVINPAIPKELAIFLSARFPMPSQFEKRVVS